MKHRYIFCGVVWEEPQLKNYRLLSGLKYSGGQAIRVDIPDNVILNKCLGDSYSTTDCDKTIHDLGCDCYLLYNDKWRKFNWLKNIEPYCWFRALEHIFGLYNCYDTIGWTDNFEYYKDWYLNQHPKNELPEGGRKYPSFREDKKGLKLKVNLDTNDEIISFLRNRSGSDEWFKFYDEFSRQLKETPGKEIWCE